MASTLRASIFTGAAGATVASAESGIKFNRDTTATGTTAIPIPAATGTNFSYHKVLGLEVTTDLATTISNRGVKMSTTTTSGLALFWKANASYAQAAAADTDSGSAGATPTGYTAMTTSNATYDAASAASSSGPGVVNGQYLQVALAVSSTYAGGAGSAIALPNIVLQYDES